MHLPHSSNNRDLTKAFSNLRLLTFLFIFFIFVISGTTVLIIATQTKENIISLTQNEIRSKAAIAALGVDGDALGVLQPGDEGTPSFIALRNHLRSIRYADSSIRNIYTMRRTGSGVEFVVDSDYGILPDAAAIGQDYPYSFEDLLAGFYAPSADSEFTSDSWGSTLSGYAPVRNSRGDVVGIIGLDMDATTVAERISYLNMVFFLVGILSILAAVAGIIVIERRRSIDEELIVANRNYLTQIFESVQAGILIVDAKTKTILDANPAALALTGYLKQEIVGQACHGAICQYMAQNCPVADLKSDLHHAETVLLTKDGESIPIIKYVLPITLDGSPCFLETFVDITDRKKAEEDLIAAVRKLKVLSVVTRNDIISDIYALAGYLELAKEEVPGLAENPLHEKIEWVMERIREKSAFFKDYDEAGTKKSVWQNLQSIISAAAGRLKTTRLSVETDTGGFAVFADQLLYKVFDNLLDNTLLHGGHATMVRVTHRITPDKNLVVIYEDNGVGISPGEKERIFERGIGACTGLGLFLAREILIITGITIRECGEPGKGARFEIVVPMGKYRPNETMVDQPVDNI